MNSPRVERDLADKLGHLLLRVVVRVGGEGGGRLVSSCVEQESLRTTFEYCCTSLYSLSVSLSLSPCAKMNDDDDGIFTSLSKFGTLLVSSPCLWKPTVEYTNELQSIQLQFPRSHTDTHSSHVQTTG